MADSSSGDVSVAAGRGVVVEAAGAEVIEAAGLVKRYGDLVAVDGVSFAVRRGEVFGILGPNGAGKTTTLEMIEGLRRPDDGQVHIDGLPVWPDPTQTKARIGVQLQATALYDFLRLSELVYLFGSCYGVRRSGEEIHALLTRVGLEEKERAYAKELSGGQMQRLSIALALVNDPVVSFLDEPTTGLDPRARRALWDVIQEIRRSGTTVVLTTHYMEEAERLCDRVAVMDRGRIVALDTPMALVHALGAEATVTFTVADDVAGESAGEVGPDLFRDLDGALSCRRQEPGYAVVATDAQAAVVSLLDLARRRGLRIQNLDVKGADLEDVFLSMTGHKLVDEEEEAAAAAAAGKKKRRRNPFGGGR
jgi:ABC-2 type transport system ATP-binding protein